MSKLELRIDSRDIRSYFAVLSVYLTQTAVTSAAGAGVELAEAVNQVMVAARRAHAAGNKLIFIGNGGSAAIASHMATDYLEEWRHALRLRSMTARMLTCLGNDLGYDRGLRQTDRTACSPRRSRDRDQQLGPLAQTSSTP